jgi:geranylgeranyl pyrophosphate synthase
VTEVKEELLSQVEESGPPEKIAPYLDIDDWEAFSKIISDYIIQEDKDRWVLEQAEIAGLQLLLSPDQKRLRPSIGMKFYDWIGSEKDRQSALQAFTMVEVVHDYTKGIDDIMDGDRFRNGFPAAHAYMKEALNLDEGEKLSKHAAYDYWLDVKSRNYSIISDLDPQFSDSEKERLRVAVEEAESKLSDGQTLDLAGSKIGEEGFHVQPSYLDGQEEMEEYTSQTNRGKTAALFGLIGTFAEEITHYDGDKLTEWGLKAGEAFQIADDVLDLENQRWSDIENGNYTLPIVLGEEYLHTSNEKELQEYGQRFTEILRADQNTEEELQEAYNILSQETPAIEASLEVAEELAEEAIQYLEEVEDEVGGSQGLEEIKSFTRMMSYQRPK